MEDFSDESTPPAVSRCVKPSPRKTAKCRKSLGDSYFSITSLQKVLESLICSENSFAMLENDFDFFAFLSNNEGLPHSQDREI